VPDAATIERTLTDALQPYQQNVADDDHRRERIRVTAAALAVMCSASGRPSRQFRLVGRKQTIRQMRALSRLTRSPKALEGLHGSTIDLLAEIGWTRERLAARPELGRAAAAAGQRALDRRALRPASMKPENLKAAAVAWILARLFHEISGEAPTRTDQQGGFVGLVEDVAAVLPGVLGNTEYVIRKTTERWHREVPG
jgi:hypothetical protein